MSGKKSNPKKSSPAVIAALAANLGIAATKFAAFIISGSSSMLAEAVHSVADGGNQVLLLVGGRRARRPPDARHPFGHGSEEYFYAFLVALLLFSVGGLVAGYEGIHKLTHPEEVKHVGVAFGVLGVCAVLEFFSLRTACRESLPLKGNASWFTFIRTTADAELPVVLLEDTAGLVGLGFAAAGVAAAALTGDGRWDGVGSLAIALLLITVAVVLAVEMKSLLVGEAAAPAVQRRILAAALDGPEIDRVIHLRTLQLGPEELLVAAKVAVGERVSAADVARRIDQVERRIRAAVPAARLIYLEPDLDRATSR
ncbi:MAG: cation diffusion facilitator family transporter [Acidothermus sp.]|nr:cation diffusion facilitator family transporter [Acidothermus sp.]